MLFVRVLCASSVRVGVCGVCVCEGFSLFLGVDFQFQRCREVKKMCPRHEEVGALLHIMMQCSHPSPSFIANNIAHCTICFFSTIDLLIYYILLYYSRQKYYGQGHIDNIIYI